MFRETMEFPDVMEEESGCFFRCDRCVHRNEVYSFEGSIHDHHDGVMSRGLWEFDHKINTEGVPPRVQNGEAVEARQRENIAKVLSGGKDRKCSHTGQCT